MEAWIVGGVGTPTTFERPHLNELATTNGIPLSDLQHCPKHSHTKPNTFGFLLSFTIIHLSPLG